MARASASFAMPRAPRKNTPLTENVNTIALMAARLARPIRRNCRWSKSMSANRKNVFTMNRMPATWCATMARVAPAAAFTTITAMK
ncbi:hypothetical protein ASC93_04275 [Massilia sp. Root335]|nr:hypothetical protein ASC93_04275 [Massilia sp. Root335]